MKISFYTSIGVPWGGSEILWVAAASRALNQGHEVLISVFDWSQQHTSIDALNKSGAKMIVRRKFYPCFRDRFKKKILNFLLPIGNKSTYHDYFIKFESDHIFFNLAGGDEIATDTNDLMLFIRQTTIPYSIFIHSLSTKKYLNDEIKNDFKFILNKAKYIFFTSKMQIDLLEWQLGVVIDKAKVINHPLRELAESHEISRGKDVNFAIIGSLVTRWKGQDTVIRILSKENWRHLNWHLNIYGDGPDGIDLEQMIEEHHLSSKVTLFRHTESINELFDANDLILIPSKQDSGPIVLFEAMFAGKPVVGSFMGAMPEYIVSGLNGVLADSTDEISFEIAMWRAWQQREKWNEWGMKGRELINERYDFNAAQTLLHFITKN